MTSRSSLTVLLDPAWPALGTDAVGTAARTALVEAGITPTAAATMTKDELRKVPGLAYGRVDHVVAYLRRLADARAADAAAVAREAGKGKRGHCPVCDRSEDATANETGD